MRRSTVCFGSERESDSKVICEKCSEALRILDGFDIAKMNKALDDVRAGGERRHDTATEEAASDQSFSMARLA
jgi:hypothetical protein